ncbi:MAG: MFS transporter [Planctomycetaceae bacterium]
MSESSTDSVVPVQRERRYLTAPDPSETGWPKGVPYIIGNEACERFSYYGMRAILQIHMTALFVAQVVGRKAQELAGAAEAAAQATPEMIQTAELQAQETVHLFAAGVYAFPMIGAVIADRLLGKYHTILSLSIVYCLGHLVLALSDDTLNGMYLGLGLIAVGSGGIKPCVSAHVGDQFGKGNWDKVSKVFQWFYFSINFGSFFATLLIPWLHEHYGAGVAFGVPGILMFLATVAFWMGRHVFVHVPARPAGQLGLLDAVSSTLMFLGFIGIPLFAHDLLSPLVLWSSMIACAAAGLLLFRTRQLKQQDDGFMAVSVYSLGALARGENRKAAAEAAASGAEPGQIERHWLFGAAAKRFGREVAEGPQAVLGIIATFAFVSVFWALFDQHMSSWIRQAKQMNLTVMGVELLPSQIQSLNPLLVMGLLPFVTFVLYPGLEKIGFQPTPLRKMTLGMFTASLAFVLVALIQRRIDTNEPNSVSVLWQFFPYLVMTLAEVMVSVTGLEFAYTQAPKPMKSTIMGLWLLAVSFGNVLVALLSRFEDLSLQNFFWLFAGLMALAAVLFGTYAMFYRYKDYSQ